MSVSSHHASSPSSVRVAVLTISDTRTEADDTSGRTARALLTAAGHVVVEARILPDDPERVSAWMEAIARSDTVDAIISAGGTGLSSRDRTYEAVVALLDKELTGFGELFRMLSYQEIGAAAMMSRAVAGLHAGVAIFACPGSQAAVRLALEKLIVPELGHVVREARR